MGHQRLGEIPKSKKWVAVVDSLTRGGAGGVGGGGGQAAGLPLVGEIAATTLDAAGVALHRAIDDQGLRYTFYLLTQLVLAAREVDWCRRLQDLGLAIDEVSTPFDLTVEFQSAVDAYIFKHSLPSDISEMAQQAAGQALTELAVDNARTLFGNGADELRESLHRLSTKNGFARLGRRFFACFLRRFLNFYVSRITASHVGIVTLPTVQRVTQVNEALDQHCQQSARIVHDFCGEWYSKTEFQQGISLENTSGFMAVALKKLQKELDTQRGGA